MQLIEKIKEISRQEAALRALYLDLISTVAGNGEQTPAMAPLEYYNVSEDKLSALGEADGASADAADPDAPPPLYVYLAAKRGTISGLGDLVRQILKDDNFPKTDFASMKEYMRSNPEQYDEKALRVLNCGYANYCRSYKL